MRVGRDNTFICVCVFRFLVCYFSPTFGAPFIIIQPPPPLRISIIPTPVFFLITSIDVDCKTNVCFMSV